MPIEPLPQFEEDLASYLKEKEDRDAYERLNAPSSIVVRFGYAQMVGEFPYSGEAKPGCGSKLVVKTHRGIELGEMLTSTCANSGCSKSVTRKEMLQYIENSGGRKYPFFEQGRVMRIAEKKDLDEQAKLEQSKHQMRVVVRGMIKSHGLEMRLVEVEPLLGRERLIVYFSSEDRIDFRDLVKELQVALENRVEMVQVGARDEARIVADYERCGQYCCCKNFLKVLKPISMKSAKIQKATLDPLKISGRCGRLMCCLRYEDETYEALRKNLPHRKSRVGTPEGDGMVIDSQILTQLSKIRLDDGTVVAVAIEDLTTPVLAKAPEPGERGGERGGQSGGRREMRREPREGGRGEGRRDSKSGGQSEKDDGAARGATSDGERPKRRRRRSGGAKAGAAGADAGGGVGEAGTSDVVKVVKEGEGSGGVKKKRRRRGSKRPRPSSEELAARAAKKAEGSGGDSASGGVSGGVSKVSGDGASGDGGSVDGGASGKKKRRRRRRRGGSGSGSDGGGGGGSESSGSGGE